MKKILIFLGIIIIIFGAIGLLNYYQKQAALKDNPYKTNDLHASTIDQLKDKNYANIILPDDLKQELENGETETVYFFSPECPHCQKTTPIVAPLAKDLGIDLKMYNVLEFEEGWDDYAIKGTPTIIHFEDGKEVARIDGYREKEVFQQWFEENVLE
ncbi:thioredoxin family protein [Caldibacillus lycopersici]|uniref:Thioredoxin family protein n=1 Tax=Perspicuibacillus lycopersici TaxID=1325689 RepID=A0AAE3ISF3_9BACI|nr:thioredoxin family protein [Perspicuibacillus lycopersici]MCU9612561.1 thioredoxin family protein [Perspicuibacillus lycopersici]